MADALVALRTLRHIQAPATLDGGDVMRLGHDLYVGTSARTNAEGIAQLRAICAPLGYRVHAVPFRGCLHLKSAVTPVADDLLLLNPAWVDADAFRGVRTLAVDPEEPFAGNALLVNGVVIHGDGFRRTHALLRAAGVTVVPVPADELAKAEGGVTCCSLLVGVSPA